MKLVVEGSACAPLPAVVHSTWGSVLCQSRAQPSQRSAPLCCAVAGRVVSSSEDTRTGVQEGSDVIALLERGTSALRGETVDANEVFEKPSRISYAHAARLPLLLLTATSALQRSGLLDESSAAGKRVLLTGSSGVTPSLLVQLLSQRGVAPLVAGLGSAPADLCALGAAGTLDPLAEDFAAKVLAAATDEEGSLAAVMDVLGDEDETALLEERLGETPLLSTHHFCAHFEKVTWQRPHLKGVI